ncbi:MAG: hypothetical protein L6Q84_22780 [Polyangiaceae bacterium]|nr:hypothetical protein [Polyangiaceae bacterium]
MNFSRSTWIFTGFSKKMSAPSSSLGSKLSNGGLNTKSVFTVPLGPNLVVSFTSSRPRWYQTPSWKLQLAFVPPHSRLSVFDGARNLRVLASELGATSKRPKPSRNRRRNMSRR